METLQTCAFHPEVETLLSCTECGTQACPDCLTQMAVGQHCVGCTQGRPVAGAKGETAFRLKQAVVGADEHTRQRRPSPLFFALIGAFSLLCTIAWFEDATIWPPDTYIQDSHSLALAKALSIAIVVIGAVIGLVLHEFAHAFVAYHGGDRTVASKGYLTLDPRRYSDPILSIAMPLVFLALGGLPLPGGAVWINHHYLRSKWWDSAVSLAGPAVNVLFGLAIIGASATGVFGDHPIVRSALLFLAYLEIAIAILNMLPIPGLDGYGVIEPHLSDGLRNTLAPMRRYSTFILLALLMNGAALGFIWDWSGSIVTGLGVNERLLGLGEYLASPRLF